MIREFILWLSESLFYIQGGVALASTFWLMIWIVFWCLVIGAPMIYQTHFKHSTWTPITSIVLFFPCIIMAVGPGIVQQQMLQECRDVTVQVETENVGLTDLDMQECRYKENYYGDFGEWKIVTKEGQVL